MKNQKGVFWALGILAILVGGFFVLNALIYKEKQADYVVGSTVEHSGTILSIDTERVALDGPVLLTVEGDTHDLVTIALPSMGLPLCPAYKANQIGDVYLMNVGDRIEVRGMVGEDGAIIPCEEADHYLRLEPIVADDFEGEADPSRMTLTMKVWSWVSASYNDGRELKPKKPETFSLTFENNGRFSATTDCNGVGGRYAIGEDGAIEFSEMVQTLMYCEGSDEAEFVQLLSTAAFYHFTSRGELVLDLKFDSGSVLFR